MPITVEFDGRFRRIIRGVSPSDVVLRGKKLYVQGIEIPVKDDRLYDVFYHLEKETRYKHGKSIIVILVDGEIEYASTTSNNTADYYANKILGFGSNSPSYNNLPHSSGCVPKDDEYLKGCNSDSPY